MTEIVIKQENTFGIRLSTHRENLSGCLLKEFHFDCSTPTFLKEIQFTNSYTESVCGKLFYQDANTKQIICKDLFKVKLMNNPHLPSGSSSNVKICLPSSYDTVLSKKRLSKICLCLQQPSRIWKEFGINNVRFLDEYTTISDQSLAKSENVFPNSDEDCIDLRNTLTLLCSLIEFKQERKDVQTTQQKDMSALADGRFEIA